MRRMELNQKKLADKVEANHNQVFEYVDRELNTMWNELNEQVESSIQMPSDNINKTEVIRIVKDELRMINKANNLNNGSFIDVSRELTEMFKSG